MERAQKRAFEGVLSRFRVILESNKQGVRYEKLTLNAVNCSYKRDEDDILGWN